MSFDVGYFGQVISHGSSILLINLSYSKLPWFYFLKVVYNFIPLSRITNSNFVQNVICRSSYSSSRVTRLYFQSFDVCIISHMDLPYPLLLFQL